MQYIQTGLEIIGAVSVFLGSLGAALPQSWGFTRFCRAAAVDLRALTGRQ